MSGVTEDLKQVAKNPVKGLVNLAEDAFKWQMGGALNFTKKGKELGTAASTAVNNEIGITGVKSAFSPEMPTAPSIPVRQSPEELASEEARRVRQAKLDEEQKLLAANPGRGGVLTPGSPTFRFL